MRSSLFHRFLNSPHSASKLHPNDPQSLTSSIDINLTKPPTSTSFDFLNNPYPARVQWPPEFSRLHPRAKFLYEKKFRRRSKLKWARPRWNKWLVTIQNFAVLGTGVYALLYMDWTIGGKMEEPSVITKVREKWRDFGAGENWKEKKDRLEKNAGDVNEK